MLQFDEQSLPESGPYSNPLVFNAIASHDRQMTAQVVVNPYPDIPSGIYLTNNQEERRLLIPVHSYDVAWSSDDQFVIYDGLHPDGTSVIAITSIDSSYTYPLLGNDGNLYHAPSWRPS
jgi:hypothetical protein